MEIKIYKYPKDTKDLLIRDFDPNLIGEAVSAISDIINDIEENGDTALLKYERQFDCPSIESLKVTEQEFEEAEAAVSQELKRWKRPLAWCAGRKPCRSTPSDYMCLEAGRLCFQRR